MVNKFYQGGSKNKDFWDNVDDYVGVAEGPVAIAGLGTTAATMIAPNPVTGVAALATNLIGAGLDLYQGTRSLIKGDWGGAIQNGFELGLSLVGAKATSSAKKLYELDRALDAAGATRSTVTRTVGRGRGKRKITMTKEKENLNDAIAVAGGANAADVALNARSSSQALERISTAPQDNTRVVEPVSPLNSEVDFGQSNSTQTSTFEPILYPITDYQTEQLPQWINPELYSSLMETPVEDFRLEEIRSYDDPFLEWYSKQPEGTIQSYSGDPNHKAGLYIIQRTKADPQSTVRLIGDNQGYIVPDSTEIHYNTPAQPQVNILPGGVPVEAVRSTEKITGYKTGGKLYR